MTKLIFTISTCGLVFIFWVQRRKRANPKSSYIMGVLNVLLSPLRYLRIVPYHRGDRVDIDRMMEDCAQKANLSDYGDLDFVNDYKTITQYPLYKSLKFSNLGLVMANMELNMVLERRLALTQYFKDVPEVLSIPVVRV
jgi:hypothetical protein